MRAPRRGDGADGSPRRAGERRRAVFGGGRSGERRLSRQLSAGAGASGAHRRRVRDREGPRRRMASGAAGGVIGTLALVTIIKFPPESGLTRRDPPLLLGPAVSDNRRKARAIGYVFHF